MSDLQALYEKARLSKKIFDRALKGLAKDLGVEAVTADLKTFDRTREKVSGKLLGEVSALTDVLRGTIICDKYSQIEAIKRKISDRFEDVKFIDRFENPKPNGYRDLQAIVLVPSKRRGEKPIWAEIQIHLRPLYMAKKSGDALYQRWRKIEEYGAHHPLSDEQSAELNSLKEQEKQLYNQALIEASQ